VLVQDGREAHPVERGVGALDEGFGFLARHGRRFAEHTLTAFLRKSTSKPIDSLPVAELAAGTAIAP
jgi:hypothetical protein